MIGGSTMKEVTDKLERDPRAYLEIEGYENRLCISKFNDFKD